jgi:hypothetical protein
VHVKLLLISQQFLVLQWTPSPVSCLIVSLTHYPTVCLNAVATPKQKPHLWRCPERNSKSEAPEYKCQCYRLLQLAPCATKSVPAFVSQRKVSRFSSCRWSLSQQSTTWIYLAGQQAIEPSTRTYIFLFTLKAAGRSTGRAPPPPPLIVHTEARSSRCRCHVSTPGAPLSLFAHELCPLQIKRIALLGSRQL